MCFPYKTVALTQIFYKIAVPQVHSEQILEPLLAEGQNYEKVLSALLS